MEWALYGIIAFELWMKYRFQGVLVKLAYLHNQILISYLILNESELDAHQVVVFNP